VVDGDEVVHIDVCTLLDAMQENSFKV
jgi:hypothetical protein